ncbi:MAG: cupin domain-containing protein [Chloroflexi bacterium]|nr:cupin domain-containing protein [Chloroflexota bacterium]
MANTGQMIENPVTGQRILFLTCAKENGGTRWEVEWFIKPHQGKFPPEHFHPVFSERFEILSGAARYKLNGQEHSARPGDTIHIPKGSTHMHPWSVSDEELHMRQNFELDEPNVKLISGSEEFFESLFALARDGKVGKDGLPNLLQFAVLAKAASPLAYPAGIPMSAVDILFGALARLGSWLGYQARYPQYSGVER